MEKRLVNVLIPVYKPELGRDDRISLSQTCRILADYPLTVVHPEGLDVSSIAAEFPQLSFHSFPRKFFAGVEGYNRFMLSEDFYEAFSEYEYVLICQLDCYLFKDDLSDWCRKGYDYVGAPWLKRSVYEFPILKQLIHLYSHFRHKQGKLTQFDRYGKVGNGGLSLRKVSSHLQVLREQPEEVRLYAEVNNRKHLFNEDTFWALVPRHFRYPEWQEAILFSYNKYPELSFRWSGGKVPFGCHGWTKSKYRPFWCREGEEPRFPSSIS